MPNYQNTANFQAPTDYTAEAQEIARRRKYAEALQAQSQEPLQGQMAGRFYVAPSWTQGANKMAQALTGGYFEKKAAEDEKKLAESANAERQQTLQRIAAFGAGVPDLAHDPEKINVATLNSGTIADSVPDLQVPNTAKPTTPQQRNLLIAQMLSSSKLPDLQAQGNKLMIEALTKENNPANSLFAKIDPSKFTQDSVEKFARTGSYGDLKPLKKLDAVNLGGETRMIDPYNSAMAGQSLQHGVSPDTTARLNNTNYWNSNLTANQQLQVGIDLGRLANQGIETQFNTGSGVSRPQAIPQQFTQPPSPPSAPQAPVPPRPIPPAINQPRPPMQPPMPQGGNMPPRMMAELALAGEKQKQEMGNKREFNMGGLNPSLDEAERILTGAATGKTPTSSSIGSMVDSVGSVFGVAPSGAAEADKLKSIGGALVAKMPRMEGPQSDKDVMLYREMAGRIGDDTIPISRRMAALQTVRDLYSKYDKQNPQIGIAGAPPLTGVTDRRAQPRGNRVVVDY
jgi:hypothetical protein